MIIDTEKLKEKINLTFITRSIQVDEETTNDRIAMNRLSALETEQIRINNEIEHVEMLAQRYLKS